MREYDVAVDQLYYGVISVNAESEEQALRLANDIIEREGLPSMEPSDNGYTLEILP